MSDDDYEAEVTSVNRRQVAQVLNRAADLVNNKTSALKAITAACDEVGGRGVRSAALHMASLDAVCRDVFGRRHGYDASVSRWERSVIKSGGGAANISFNLRRIAKATATPKSMRFYASEASS